MIFLVAAALIWSASFVATKIAYQSFGPITVGMLRTLIAWVFLETYCYRFRPKDKVSRRDRAQLYVSGFIGVAGYFVLENTGVLYTTSGDAALIVAFFPAIALFLEFIGFRRWPTIRQSIGVIFAVVGVLLIIQSAESTSGTSGLLGNVLICGAGATWAIYNFMTRNIVNRYSMPTVLQLQTRSGLLGLVVACFFEKSMTTGLTPQAFWALLYLGAFCSLLAYYLYAFALKRISATTAVTTLNIVPVGGVLLSVTLLRETLRFEQLLGGAIVILGVLISASHAEK